MSQWRVTSFRHLPEDPGYSMVDGAVESKLVHRGQLHRLDVSFQLDDEALASFMRFMLSVGCTDVAEKIRRSSYPPPSDVRPRFEEEEPPTFIPPAKRLSRPPPGG